MYAVTAHSKIVALHQQEPEIARQRRVFEIGFAERAGGKQPDAGLVAVGAGTQTIAERFEKRRQPLDIHRFVERREGARQHQPVFKGIARARGRLRAVAEHPPAPVRTAADIGRIDVEVSATGRLDAAHRTQIFGTTCDRRGRDRALRDQPAIAVEVAQHQLQQLCPLDDTFAQLLPLGFVDQQRQMA